MVAREEKRKDGGGSWKVYIFCQCQDLLWEAGREGQASWGRHALSQGPRGVPDPHIASDSDEMPSLTPILGDYWLPLSTAKSRYLRVNQGYIYEYRSVSS